MSKPRLLDLFCGAGGAAMGYHRAGFEVVGVDIKPQKHYPFEFHQADAMTYPLDGFDVIHASPPCQPFTKAQYLRQAQGKRSTSADLIEATRARLRGLWVMENVVGSPVPGLVICGSSFGLRVRRHRLFESTVLLLAHPCQHLDQGKPVGVYHRLGDTAQGRSLDPADPREWVKGGTTARTIEEAREAMGIDWMTFAELKEAIPPAYTEFIGHQLMAHLAASRVVA